MTKIAIMSFAHVHAAGYATLLAGMPGVQVMGSDPGDHRPEETRGAELAHELGIDYVDTYDELLAWGPDAVVITSENANHRGDVERAAAAGAHILCEKPLATTWEDGLAIRDAVQRAGVLLMVAYPVRFSTAFRRLQDQNEVGALGDLVTIRGYNNGMLPIDRAWFTDPALAGGGAMVDHLVHVADMIDALTGAKPRRVTAISNSLLYPDRPAESSAVALVEYDNGLQAAFDSSWSVPQHAPAWGGLKMSVLGTSGTVDIDFFGAAARGISSAGLPIEARYGANFDQAMLDCFVRAVRTGQQPQPDVDTGLRTLSIVLAAQESARTGCTIDIDTLSD